MAAGCQAVVDSGCYNYCGGCSSACLLIAELSRREATAGALHPKIYPFSPPDPERLINVRVGKVGISECY